MHRKSLFSRHLAKQRALIDYVSILRTEFNVELSGDMVDSDGVNYGTMVSLVA